MEGGTASHLETCAPRFWRSSPGTSAEGAPAVSPLDGARGRRGGGQPSSEGPAGPEPISTDARGVGTSVLSYRSGSSGCTRRPRLFLEDGAGQGPWKLDPERLG